MDIGVVGNRRSAAVRSDAAGQAAGVRVARDPGGRPTLKTIEHYFTDDMVRIYEPEDVESLTDAIYPAALRAGRAARSRPHGARAFLDDHGWERQGAELVAMYQQLVEN